MNESGGSGDASNKEQAVVDPPPQVAITPPRSSEPPSGLPKLEFLLRGDRDKQISPDERAERHQMQDDIDWLAKWLIENAYHQIKKSGFEYEVEFMDMDDLIGSGLWWHEAITAISNEDVMEQLQVLERQLHEAPDKVYVQVILGWTSYQMWKGGHDIQFMKRQSHVQDVDIQDEYWKILRQGLREH
ncbi:hypothetical protein CcaCcLH18_11930 [Colletotrichum camelliae]|nr:hypothetical protein CcaCcLH18_11930 [Colletotrichum camelliae]